VRATLAGVLAALLALPGAAEPSFDHGYGVWDGLLRAFVAWLPDGAQSRVDYAGFAANRARLETSLDQLSAVAPSEFERWSRPQQLAFLINAYNAFTVELILTGWPALSSIKDLGSFLRSPWRRPFFVLLGAGATSTGSSTSNCDHAMPSRVCTLPSTARRSAARRCAPRPSSPHGSTVSSRTRCGVFSATAPAIASPADASR
jgi:hypothetical protein